MSSNSEFIESLCVFQVLCSIFGVCILEVEVVEEEEEEISSNNVKAVVVTNDEEIVEEDEELETEPIDPIV